MTQIFILCKTLEKLCVKFCDKQEVWPKASTDLLYWTSDLNILSNCVNNSDKMYFHHQIWPICKFGRFEVNLETVCYNDWLQNPCRLTKFECGRGLFLCLVNDTFCWKGDFFFSFLCFYLITIEFTELLWTSTCLVN